MTWLEMLGWAAIGFVMMFGLVVVLICCWAADMKLTMKEVRDNSRAFWADENHSCRHCRLPVSIPDDELCHSTQPHYDCPCEECMDKVEADGQACEAEEKADVQRRNT